MRNFFLILKWFYFLSFSQNWPICRGLKFSLLKIDDFPFSWVSAPGTPEGVKIGPKIVPMIFTGHIIKTYGEIGQKNVWNFKVSDYTNTDPHVKKGWWSVWLWCHSRFFWESEYHECWDWTWTRPGSWQCKMSQSGQHGN